MSFLEVQLERVSSACLTVQGYDDRFGEIEALCQQANRRVVDAVKTMEDSQDIATLAEKSFAETQISIKHRLSQIEGARQEEEERMAELKRSLDGIEPRMEKLVNQARESVTEYSKGRVEELKKALVRQEATAAEQLVKVNSEASVNVVQQCNKLGSHIKELLAVQRSELNGAIKSSSSECSSGIDAIKQQLSKHEYNLTQIQNDTVSREELKAARAEIAEQMSEVIIVGCSQR